MSHTPEVQLPVGHQISFLSLLSACQPLETLPSILQKFSSKISPRRSEESRREEGLSILTSVGRKERKLYSFTFASYYSLLEN